MLVRKEAIAFSTTPTDSKQKNARVVFTRWKGIECMNYSPLIYAFGQENIAITGKGTLDGGSDETTWWDWNKRSDKVKKERVGRAGVVRRHAPVNRPRKLSPLMPVQVALWYPCSSVVKTSPLPSAATG
jgi:polygalacturonase